MKTALIKRFQQNSIYVFSACLLCFTQAQADDARSIMQQVIDRDDGASQYSLQSIATCKYEIRQKKIACVEKPRKKVVEMIQMDSPTNSKDSLSVSIINKPSSEKGIGFLQHDYDEQGKDTDQWMYLSALGKIKRIVSGNDNEPKKGTLFGSEFGYEDTEKVKIENFTYRILKEGIYRGRAVWVIESTPTPQHARKSNYSKSILWVDKKRHLIHKSQLFDRRARLLKQMSFSQYQKISGVWVAKKMNMNNRQTKRISTLKINKIAINIAVDASLLSKRTLTDGAFREQHLKRIRQNTQ